jgi:hypothetical protein
MDEMGHVGKIEVLQKTRVGPEWRKLGDLPPAANRRRPWSPSIVGGRKENPRRGRPGRAAG